MTEFEEALKARALSNLNNPTAVTDDLIIKAAAETDEMCGSKAVPSYTRLDLGMYRLKVNMKIGISEQDEFLYKEALKVIRESKDPDDTTDTGFCKVKNRDDLWL